jgi:tetratricopeptide (TPR) repeat protein
MRAGISILIFLTVCINPAFPQGQKKPYQLFEQADREFNEGHLDTALTLVNECLKLNAGYFEAYPLRGSIKEQLGKFDEALTDFSIYLESFPDNPEVLMNRGTLRYKIGFLQQAKEDFRHLLNVPPPKTTNSLLFKQRVDVRDTKPIITIDGKNHNPYVYNYLGLIEMKAKNPRLAIAYFDSAITFDNKDPDFYVNRGLSKEAINDTTAITDYDIALHLQPDHALARHNMAAFVAKHSNTSLEERLTNTIRTDSTLLYPYLERAQDRYARGDYLGALADYDHALATDEDNIEILLGRALTKEKLNDLKGAFSDYTAAIELKEDYAKAWLNRGNLLLKMNRHADAIEDYNVALVYYHDYPSAYYNRAMAKARLKNLDEACIDLKHAEELGMIVDEKVKSKVCVNR